MTDRDRNHYESKCNALDRQIENLVYELYGLTYLRQPVLLIRFD